MKGWVEETEVHMLRDTGCNGVIVKYALVPPQCFTGCHQQLILMDRSVIDGPVAKVRVDTPVFCGEVYALCIQNPICDLIIGNITGAQQVSLEATTTEEMPSTTSTEEVLEQIDTAMACAMPTRGWHALQMTPDEFQAAQKADTELSRYFEIARDDMVDKGIDTTTWFEVSGGVWFRLFRRPTDGTVSQQAIVPRGLRKEVLHFGHDAGRAGHLGVKGTAGRILAHFFWLGMFRDIRRFCRSCNVCQQTTSKWRVKKERVLGVHVKSARTMSDDRHGRHSLFSRACRRSRTVGQWREYPRHRRPTRATYSFL